MTCKFCRYESCSGIDFYCCDSCESIMCINCMHTSVKTGKDYCMYCRQNLQYEGKQL